MYESCVALSPMGVGRVALPVGMSRIWGWLLTHQTTSYFEDLLENRLYILWTYLYILIHTTYINIYVFDLLASNLATRTQSIFDRQSCGVSARLDHLIDSSLKETCQSYVVLARMKRAFSSTCLNPWCGITNLFLQADFVHAHSFKRTRIKNIWHILPFHL